MLEEREMSGVISMLLYQNFHMCNTFYKYVENANILRMTVQILHKIHYNFSLKLSNRFKIDNKR
jgi:hypothetical protein